MAFRTLSRLGVWVVGIGALQACSSGADPGPAAAQGGFAGVAGGLAMGGGGPGGGGAPGAGGYVSGTGNTPGQGGSVTVGGSTSAGGSMSVGGTTSAGGAGAGGGGAGMGGSGAGGAPAEKPPCIANAGTDVLMMGDSYVTGALGSPALQPALAKVFPSAAQFRNVAVAGVSMASGGIGALIPTQFNGKPKLVIMDGGGNDILICSAVMYPGCNTMCNAPGSSSLQICKDIVTSGTAAAAKLFDTMSAAGVKDIVYFFYPHPPTNNGGMKEIDDYSEPIARKSCEDYAGKNGGKTRCYWVSTTKPFADAGGDINAANFWSDGIHPSAKGQDIIAGEINKVLTAHCLGQTSSSGCCQ